MPNALEEQSCDEGVLKPDKAKGNLEHWKSVQICEEH